MLQEDEPNNRVALRDIEHFAELKRERKSGKKPKASSASGEGSAGSASLNSESKRTSAGKDPLPSRAVLSGATTTRIPDTHDPCEL